MAALCERGLEGDMLGVVLDVGHVGVSKEEDEGLGG